MTDDLFKDLASISKSLNEASDSLSKQISQVEAALNELKLGIWAWIPVKNYQTESDFTIGGKRELVTKVESLGYGKHNGKWGLLFSTSYEEYPDPDFETVIFLRDAPRMERIEAVDKLPDLMQALRKRMREVAQLATTRANNIAGLADALRQVAG